MEQILDAIQSGASGDDIANLPIPESYRAAFVKRDDVGMFVTVQGPASTTVTGTASPSASKTRAMPRL